MQHGGKLGRGSRNDMDLWTWTPPGPRRRDSSLFPLTGSLAPVCWVTIRPRRPCKHPLEPPGALYCRKHRIAVQVHNGGICFGTLESSKTRSACHVSQTWASGCISVPRVWSVSRRSRRKCHLLEELKSDADRAYSALTLRGVTPVLPVVGDWECGWLWQLSKLFEVVCPLQMERPVSTRPNTAYRQCRPPVVPPDTRLASWPLNNTSLVPGSSKGD